METLPGVGEIITVRGWGGESLVVKVAKIFESPTYGVSIKGTEVDGGRFIALPLAHRIEAVLIRNAGWGKWDISLPDGTTERLSTKQKAKDRILELGYVPQEAV